MKDEREVMKDELKAALNSTFITPRSSFIIYFPSCKSCPSMLILRLPLFGGGGDDFDL
jgi:hypothetical protein